MKINLTCTTIPCIDTLIAAHFYKRVLNFISLNEKDKEILVQVNNNLSLKLEEEEEYTNNLYSFNVDKEYFEQILLNIKKEKIYFGSKLNHLENMKVFEDNEKKELFFIDPNGHLFQIIYFIED